MINYWKDLVDYKQKEKEHRYFRAEVDSDGEAKRDTIVEINFIEERNRIREQLQEDIRSWCSTYGQIQMGEECIDDLCQIVVDNFKDFD